MKVLILDSGPLINFSMNGIIPLIQKLKETSNVEFVITKDVYREVVEKPSTIPRFELGALKIKKLVESDTIKFPSELNIDEKQIEKESVEIMNSINKSLETNRKNIHVVSTGETSCLALSRILSKKKIENLIAIDERTTRLIFEKPANLEKVMSRKLHMKVKINFKDLDKIGEFKFIRSSELVYVAHKKGLTELKDQKGLEAILYATKYKGTSISFEEIDVLKKL